MDTGEQATDTRLHWQRLAVPPELHFIGPGATEGLQRIVHEIQDHCIAVQASAISLQQQQQSRTFPYPNHFQDTVSLQSSQTWQTAPSSTHTFHSTSNHSGTLPSAEPSNGFRHSRERRYDQETSKESHSGSAFDKSTTRRPWRLALNIVRTFLPSPCATAECSSCFEQAATSRIVRAGCTHHFCRPCFIQMATTAMQNERLWPPRCCLTDIPRAQILACLPKSEQRRFVSKECEYALPPQDRWYCAEPSCGQWFAPDGSRGDDVRCPRCRAAMCRHCRGAAHARGAGCPQDHNLTSTLQTAAQHGWRQCHRCHALVELRSGCRHISCPCGAEFCYTCGARWRTCRCTELDQLHRADQLQRQREADEARALAQQQEDVELQEALRQVAEAERVDAERRQAEEERQQAEEAEAIERVEAERVSTASAYFDELRRELARLHETQSSELAARHSRTTVDVDNAQAGTHRAVAQLSTGILDVRITIAIRRRAEHAAYHRARADNEAQYLELLAPLAPLPPCQSGGTPVEQAARNVRLAALAMERNTLDRRHRRTLDDLELEELAEVREMERGIAENHAKQEAQQRADAAARGAMDADLKWLEFAAAERLRAVDEEEQRVLRHGLPAPFALRRPGDARAELTT